MGNVGGRSKLLDRFQDDPDTTPHPTYLEMSYKADPDMFLSECHLLVTDNVVRSHCGFHLKYPRLYNIRAEAARVMAPWGKCRLQGDARIEQAKSF
jgi:hypothetical protein